jgi:hypothetical protein
MMPRLGPPCSCRWLRPPLVGWQPRRGRGPWPWAAVHGASLASPAHRPPICGCRCDRRYGRRCLPLADPPLRSPRARPDPGDARPNPEPAPATPRGIARAREPVVSSPPALAGRERGAAKAVGVACAVMTAFGMRPRNAADGRPRLVDTADTQIRLPDATFGRGADWIRGVIGQQPRPLTVGLMIRQGIEPKRGTRGAAEQVRGAGDRVALPPPRVAAAPRCRRPRLT